MSKWILAALAAFVVLSTAASALGTPAVQPTQMAPPEVRGTIQDLRQELRDALTGAPGAPGVPGLPALPSAPSAPASPAPPTGPAFPAVPPVPAPPAGLPDTVQGLEAVVAEKIASALSLVSQQLANAQGAAQNTADRATEQIRQVAAPLAAAPESAASDGPAPTAAAAEGILPFPILAGTLLVAGAAGATLVGFWMAGSSGTLGAGAGAKVAGGELRRLLPFASPLFTRFEKDTVLGHPRREALYANILQQPGISLQSLGDATGLSRTAVLHHLRLLELQHLVVSKRMGRSRHYYENGGRFGRDQKEAFAILQNTRSKDVADFIRTHPGAMQKALCAALAIQPSIAHWHVRRLQAADLVEAVRKGRTVTYFPGQALAGLHSPVPEGSDMAPAVA